MASSYPYPIPATPRVISPSPTPSESDRQEYFPPVTRSATRHQRHKSPPAIREEKEKEKEKDGGESSGSDSSLDQRARARSRSPAPTVSSQTNGSARVNKRHMSGLTPKTTGGSSSSKTSKTTASSSSVTKSEPLINGLPLPSPGLLSPYDRVKKSWREFSRSPSPLGLIPLHRHYRTLIHRHEVPRKALHLSIGFLTLQLYVHGVQTTQITPWLLTALVPIASLDVLRHRFASVNRLYVRVCGALMRETEVDGYNGVIWYLLGTYVALRFYPKDVGVMSVVLLSWCDTAASTFGRLYGRYTIRLRKGKSLAGTLAAFATGALSALYFWGYLAPRTGPFPTDPPGAFMFTGQLRVPDVLKPLLGWSTGAGDQPSRGVIDGTAAMAVMSVASGVIASVSEFVDVLGWDDNLTIPLLTSFGLWAMLKVFG